MGQPDTRIGQMLFAFTLVCFAVIPFTLIIVYMKLSSLCKNRSNTTKKVKVKVSSGKKFIMSLIFICILSGLAAQAINHSYTVKNYT